MLVRDTVHGDVELNALESAVLDTAAVQRLRGIKQLGTAYLVYPGALHSRFEHSLGTAFVSHRIVASLRRSGVTVSSDLENWIGVAALLHDVTHVPFGHTLEDERRLFPRHDKGDRFSRLLEGSLGTRLDELGIRQVIECLVTNAPSADTPAWAGEVVSSMIDADLLDYLRRDSLYAGLAQSYDDRVFRYFTVAEDRLVLDVNKHGMTRPDAWSELVQLLRMRYFLTERVYYHHTKVISGAMISKAVEIAVDREALNETDLLDLNDWTLLEYLANADRTAALLIRRIKHRALFKRAYVLSSASLDDVARKSFVERFHVSRETRARAERDLASATGLPADEIVVYCPALTMMKESLALVRSPEGLVPMHTVGFGGASEIDALAARHAALWRFYVFAPEEHAARVGSAAEELFGTLSEYRGGR